MATSCGFESHRPHQDPDPVLPWQLAAAGSCRRVVHQICPNHLDAIWEEFSSTETGLANHPTGNPVGPAMLRSGDHEIFTSASIKRGISTKWHPMTISAVNSQSILPITSERSQAPGPDHGKVDDLGSVQQSAQTVPAPSSGKIVDLTA